MIDKLHLVLQLYSLETLKLGVFHGLDPDP